MYPQDLTSNCFGFLTVLVLGRSFLFFSEKALFVDHHDNAMLLGMYIDWSCKSCWHKTEGLSCVRSAVQPSPDSQPAWTELCSQQLPFQREARDLHHMCATPSMRGLEPRSEMGTEPAE